MTARPAAEPKMCPYCDEYPFPHKWAADRRTIAVLVAALRDAMTLLDVILPESDDIRIRCRAALAKAEAGS